MEYYEKTVFYICILIGLSNIRALLCYSSLRVNHDTSYRSNNYEISIKAHYSGSSAQGFENVTSGDSFRNWQAKLF